MRLPRPHAPAWLRVLLGFFGFLLAASVLALWFGWQAVGLLEWLGLPIESGTAALHFFASTDVGRLVVLGFGILFVVYAVRAESVSEVQMRNRVSMLNRWNNFMEYHFLLVSFTARFTNTETYREMRPYLRWRVRRRIRKAEDLGSAESKYTIHRLVGDEMDRLAKKWGLI